MKLLRWLLVLLLLGAAFAGGYLFRLRSAASISAMAERKILYWHDPMHPWYRSDKPGIAPDCGMKLEPVYADGAAASANQHGRVLYYYDPKQPSYRAENPGLNPETGNELVARREGESEPMPAGTVHVSAERQALIGVRYGVAEITRGGTVIRAPGKVAVDERRIHHVHVRTEGWIDRVEADFVGREVKAGQLLLTIYSPELLASQKELLLALSAREKLRGSSMPGTGDQVESLIEASRNRLRQWEVTDAQIAELERTRQPFRVRPVYSPAGGIITMRNAFPHQLAKPDTELYTIVDFSRVWILADILEYESAKVGPGTAAIVSLPQSSGRRYPARVSFVQPEVDKETRTVRVRLELDNPGLALKPEMFVDVEFRLPASSRLTVPADAVLDTGLRRTVLVDRGNGYFEPRAVEAGERIDGRIVILRGLKAGERIVTSGNFLIDSESQMKSALQGMTPSGHEGHAQ